MPTVRQFYIENKHEINKRINTDFAYEVIIDEPFTALGQWEIPRHGSL